jgi:hypothetical protein
MALTSGQAKELRGMIEERRRALQEELQDGVERSREANFEDLAGPAPDAGDE